MAFGIWNNLDELGLYMGLERISYETDEEYSNRLKQFAVYKYKTDYYTQVHSIPLQLGLETYEVMRLTCSHTDIDGKVTVIPFECKIDWEYAILENFPPAGLESQKEYIRIFINNHDATVKKIMNTLDTSLTFKYITLKGKHKRLPCKFLIRNTNIGHGRDFVNSKHTRLSNKDIITGSLVPEDILICKKPIASILEMKHDGDYFIDTELGYLQTQSDVQFGFFVTYQYYKPSFSIEGTELNFTPLNILAKYGLSDQLAEYAKVILENKVWGK
jgi:hypothetical protein